MESKKRVKSNVTHNYNNTENVESSKKNRKNNSFVNNILNDFFDFYKNNLRKTHIIIYIISLVLFAIFVTSNLSKIDSTNNIANQVNAASNSLVNVNIFKTFAKEKVPAAFLSVLAGIVPYFYIPILCIYYTAVLLAGNIFDIYQQTGGMLRILPVSISSVLQLIGFSLAISIGIYYCNRGTKRHKYSQNKGVGLNDIKYKFYELKGDKKKEEQMLLKKQKDEEKNEKLNVKIDYKNIIVGLVLSIFIVFIFTLIELI